jgi:hypothetical protein
MAPAKASFKRSFKSKAVEGGGAAASGGGGGESGSAWRPDLDCSGAVAVPEDMPKDALPQAPRTGKFNYTVYSRGLDGPRIEVQLKNKCFYLKKSGGDPIEGSKVVGWVKSGGIEPAWGEATRRTGWYLLVS